MDQRRWMYIGGLAVLAAVIVFFTARPAPGMPTYEDEPRVTVVDAETGEREEIPIEEYIKGVVAGEMKPDWPVKAYAAQAILARSFAMDFLNREEGNEISTDHEVAQAYTPENITPEIEEAVQMTRGEVMTHQNQFVRAWFHAYSGGHTASAKEGLAFEEAEPPYIASVQVPENEFAPDDVTNWRAVFTLEEVTTAVSEAGIDVGTVEDVRVEEEGPTGRITQVTIIGSEGEQTMTGPDFRIALGAETMKSTLVEAFSVEGDQLAMEGTGFGHGVGLSQWDAFMFAQEDRSPEDIVNFFFDGIRIVKLWD